jgi:hypothetical protein
MNELTKKDPTGGWKIDLAPDGTFLLVHPAYTTIDCIPSFDEACDMRTAMVSGKFISFVRARERFLESLKKIVSGVR